MVMVYIKLGGVRVMVYRGNDFKLTQEELNKACAEVRQTMLYHNVKIPAGFERLNKLNSVYGILSYDTYNRLKQVEEKYNE